MVYFEWLIQINVSELLQHGRARRSVFGPQNRAEIFCRSLPPKSAFLLQPDDVRSFSEDQPRSGRVELKLLRPFKERSRSRGGCKQPQWRWGLFMCLLQTASLCWEKLNRMERGGLMTKEVKFSLFSAHYLSEQEHHWCVNVIQSWPNLKDVSRPIN